MKKKIIVGVILLAVLMTLGYAYFIEPNLLTVKTIDIKTSKPIKPMKIVFFTDTHFGKHYGVGQVRKIVDKINDRQPDIVVFGGDLLDNYARDREDLDITYLQEELARIKARVGKYAVRGNHDYGGGSIRVYDDVMSSSGFRVLDNEIIPLEEYGMKLIGYDDYLMGYTDPAAYIIEGDSFHVIIAHEPIAATFIQSEGDNFMLSGHTHGGQVYVPILTKMILPPGSGEFQKGFYDKEDIGTDVSMRMYNSSGIGMTIFPIRFLNVPEIVEVNIKKS